MAMSYCRGTLGIALAAAFLAGCGGTQLPVQGTPAGRAATLPRDAAHGYQVIYAFKGTDYGSGDGAFPESLTVMSGKLYGATSQGGSGGAPGCYVLGYTGCGTLFELRTSGKESLLHTFEGPPNVEFPLGGVTNLNGAWYGLSYGGRFAQENSYGYGVVYRVDRSGQEHLVYTFQGGYYGDGAIPHGELVLLDRRFYGTTYNGGSSYNTRTSHGGYGTVFEVTPSGHERVLHNFKGSDGAYPSAGLIALNGTLYGTTTQGGKYNLGTVFSITTSGKERVLYSFRGGNDSADPTAPLTAVDGALYGTTMNALGTGKPPPGTVFKLSLSGGMTVLHRFRSNGRDGAFPQSRLLDLNGQLYGTTNRGGDDNDGTVFSLSYTGDERILHSFAGGADGATPNGDLTVIDSTLYGTTNGGGYAQCQFFGGKSYACGTVYKLRP